MIVLLWVGLGAVAVLTLLVVTGLFVEERAMNIPRLYEDESLRT